MKILIYDDDKVFVEKLKQDILKYFKESIPLDQITKIDTLETIDSSVNYDIVFMDIDIDGTNGINVSRGLKTRMPNMLLIFTSSREDLIFDTLSIGVFQFIRKSNYNYDFMITMGDLKRYLKNNNNYIVIDNNKRKQKIYIDNIKYIISIGHDITINCYDGEITFRATLISVLEKINSLDIVQVNRTLAMNYKFMDEVGKNVIKCAIGEVQIGRKYQKNFLEKYEEYLIK